MSEFNARAARAKRPCPIWVDAFQRDTQHLNADEIGAYFLILMAMWTRESCDFPDDDNRLARVSRVSVRLWKSRIGPVIRAFLSVEGGAVISKRLRQEAAYVENEVQKQSDRKRGAYAKPQGDNNASQENDEKSDKPLDYNEPHTSTDDTTDEPGYYPSQQPNNLHKESSSSSARGADDARPEWTPDRLWDELISAVGVDQGRLPSHWMPPAAVIHAWRWVTDWKIPPESVVDAARNSRKRHDTPPSGPKALDTTMRSLANAIAGESLPPITAPINSAPASRPGGHGIVPQVPEKYRQ